ncbi:MAG: hypothetical protein ONB44_17125 [candidate division KSB1 bacterium]|nr:hypothetical protein [candidate division KSB1 bacterium]MDZ7303858.1 hypothetical protein [candidate division KSB1 bacterium]MDZ7312759.1 hypothetical protein [candidate division KSB1 bacterium]
MRYYLLILFCSATTLYSQVKTSHFITRPSFRTGAIFQRWTGEGRQQIDELVVPLVMHYPVSERFSVSVLNMPTSAKLRRADSSSSLTAFTDTRISTAFILGEERAVLNLGVGIPSGPTALKFRELSVAQEITSHALAMPMSYFGGGGEVSASIAVATELGKWILGGSVGGAYKASYVPIAGFLKYRPGPEISIAIGFDRTLGERSRIFGDAGYTWYGRDQYGGKDIFQSDGKANFTLAGIFASEKWQSSVLLQNTLKRKSPFALDNSFSVSYGNEFELATELARQINPNSALLAVANVRALGKNANGNSAATVVSFGPGWRGTIMPQVQLEAVARLAAGEIDGNPIRGGEAELGFIFQF